MEKLLIRVYEAPRLSRFFALLSHTASALSALAFVFMLGYEIYLGEYVIAVKIAAAAFVGFVLVSVFRKLIDAPRPYELHSFYTVKPKDKTGSSFPSRHAYSAFSIATLAIAVSLPLAVTLYILGAAMCLCRVLLGIHFIRDVCAGALIGALAGIIGLIII